MLRREHDKQFVVIRVKQIQGKPCALCVSKHCTEWTSNCIKCKWGRTKGRAKHALPEPYYKNEFKINPKYLYDNVVCKDTVELDGENVKLQNELNSMKEELITTQNTIKFFKHVALKEKILRKLE